MPYPSREEAYALFEYLGRGENDKFFARVRSDVDWAVMGTSPVSKEYKSLRDFQEQVLDRLKKNTISSSPGLKIHVRFLVMGSGGKATDAEDGWVTAEMHAHASCVDGTDYRMVYCWVCKFDADGMIERVRAYLDTEALTEAIVRNECGVSRADPHF